MPVSGGQDDGAGQPAIEVDGGVVSADLVWRHGQEEGDGEAQGSGAPGLLGTAGEAHRENDAGCGGGDYVARRRDGDRKATGSQLAAEDFLSSSPKSGAPGADAKSATDATSHDRWMQRFKQGQKFLERRRDSPSLSSRASARLRVSMPQGHLGDKKVEVENPQPGTPYGAFKNLGHDESRRIRSNQSPDASQEQNQDYGSPTPPSDPSPTGAVAWAMAVSSTGNGLVRRDANPELARGCDAGDGKVENSVLQAALVEKEREISQLKSGFSQAAEALRALKIGTEELLDRKDQIIAKLQSSALDSDPLEREDKLMSPLISSKQFEPSPDPMPSSPFPVNFDGISQVSERIELHRSTLVRPASDSQRADGSNGGSTVREFMGGKRGSSFRAVRETLNSGVPRQRLSRSLGREEYRTLQEKNQVVDKESLFHDKASTFAGTGDISPGMKAIVWSSSNGSAGLVPDVSAWISHRPVSPSKKMQAQLMTLSFKEGHSPRMRSMDSAASGSQRGTFRIQKSASGDFNAVPKKISTPYPNAEFGTEGRHPAQSQSSIAKEEDLFHWQSMVRYARPWNLYGQHLSRPLKRVIGQMTVPDVEDHKVLDTNKDQGPGVKHVRQASVRNTTREETGFITYLQKQLIRHDRNRSISSSSDSGLKGKNKARSFDWDVNAEQNIFLTRIKLVWIVITTLWIPALLVMEFVFMACKLILMIGLESFSMSSTRIYCVRSTLDTANPNSTANFAPNTSVFAVHYTIVILLSLGILSRMLSQDAHGDYVGCRYVAEQTETHRSSFVFLSYIINYAFIFSSLASLIVMPIGFSLCTAPFGDTNFIAAWAMTAIFQAVRIWSGIFCFMDAFHDVKVKMREALTSNRRRFIDNAELVNLDLTYTCDRVIVMSLPFMRQSLFHNDIRDVGQFLASRHYGSFVVCNVCEYWEENGMANYDHSELFNQVQSFPTSPHGVPQLFELMHFLRMAGSFLQESPDNVVVIHCSDGCDRSAFFSACLFLWTGLAQNGQAASDIFSERRTHAALVGPKRGVYCPCQLRYLKYVEQICFDHVYYLRHKVLLINKVEMVTMPFYSDRDSLCVNMVIEGSTGIIYDHAKAHGVTVLKKSASPQSDLFTFTIDHVAVFGDFYIRFYWFDAEVNGIPHDWRSGQLGDGKSTINYDMVSSSSQVCMVVLNTNFHNGGALTLSREEIDGTYGKSFEQFHQKFSLTIETMDENDEQVGEFWSQPMERTVHPQPMPEDAELEVDNSVDANKALAIDIDSIASNVLEIGIPPGLRYLRLLKVVPMIMGSSSCTETVTYKYGEIIYDPNQHTRGNPHFRMLGYVESGCAVAIQPVETKRGTQNASTNHVSPIAYGVGDFYGEMDFLLGVKQVKKIPRMPLRCNSDTMTCKLMWLPGSPDWHVSTEIGGLPPKAATLFFEAIARPLMTRMRHIVQNLSSKTAKASQRKQNHRKREAVDMRIKDVFELPAADPLLYMTFATVQSGILLQGHRGKLLMYENYVAWTEMSLARFSLGVAATFIFPIASIIECFRTGSFITLSIMDGSNNSHLPVDRPMIDLQSFRFRRDRGWNRRGKPDFKDIFDNNEGSDIVTVYLKIDDQNECIDLLRMIKQAITAYSKITHEADPKTITIRQGGGQRNRTKDSMATVSTGSDGEDDRERFLLTFEAAQIEQLFSDKLTHFQVIQLGLVFGYVTAMEDPSPADVDGLVQLFSQAKRVRYVDQETVIHVGSTNRRLIHIIKGHVTIRTVTGSIIARVGAGKTLGELTFLEVGNRGSGARAVAEESLSVIVMDYNTVENLSLLHPVVGARFFRALAISSAERLMPYLAPIEEPNAR